MNIRSCCLLGVYFLIFLTTEVFALQHSEKRWSGVYAGGELGSAGDNVKVQTGVVPGGTYFGPIDANAVNAAGIGHISRWNFSGGMFAGYDYQLADILAGIEVSANRLSLNNSQSSAGRYITDPIPRFVLSQTLKVNWQETLRFRLGCAQNRWLAYLTGGAAATRVKYTSSFSDNNANAGSGLPGAWGVGQTLQTKYGWVMGGGGEYAINQRWAIKGEYLYSNFGHIETTYNLIPTPTLSEFSDVLNGKANLIIQSILLGLIYRI